MDIISKAESLSTITGGLPNHIHKSGVRPRISVLMPVYNNVAFLGEAVESILSQSFMDFEFVIIDDGSSDGSPEILAAYAAKDARIRLYLNENNRGIVFALNRGLKECQGDYIVRMDQDDIALPERLKKQFAFMEANPEVVVSGAALQYMDARGRDLGVVRRVKTGASLLAGNPLFHPTVIIRREALLRHAFSYREEYNYAEDYFLWLQLSRVGKLGGFDEVVLKYRISSGAMRIRGLKKMLLTTLRVKLAGVFSLGIRPTGKDIMRFIAESVLLLLPASLVFRMYQRMTFGKRVRIQL